MRIPHYDTFLFAATIFVSLAIDPVRAAETPPAVKAAAETIHGRLALAHIKLLASRHLEGRETGSDGFDLAADYVQAQHESYGLSGGGKSGDFSQEVRLRYSKLGDDNQLAITEKSGSGTAATHYLLGDEYQPFVFSAAGKVAAAVVFVGYGISAPDHGWDDYKGVDVRGKVVLMLRHEPRENDGKSVFEGKRSSRHATFLTKARLAQSRGAVAMLLVTDPLNHDDSSPGNRLASWPQLNQAEYQREGREVPEGRPVLAERYDDFTIPALHISGRVAARLLAGSGRSLEEWQRALDDGNKPLSRALDGKTVELTTSFAHRYFESRNVIARITGRDPELKHQVVIIGAHLDHVGKDWRGQIHPGADDNASGTSGLLEVARAMASLPEPPRRTMLFVSFTAEEMGLLGSSFFVEKPVVPLDSIVAVLNLDMIGRNTPGQVNVVGKRDYPAVHDRIVAANHGIGLELKYDAGAGAARSDNFPFQTKGVPALSFFTGTHDDYHEPGDVSSKIVPGKLEAIARLVFLTAWDLADDATMTPTAARFRPQPNPPDGSGPKLTAATAKAGAKPARGEDVP